MQRFAILAVFVLCGTLELSSATTCKAATGSTCAKSLFVTGSCTNDACACASGFVAGPYGCQKRQKASVSADQPGFNGEVEAQIKLTCSGDTDYKWYKDGTEVSTTTIDNTISATGSYSCQSTIAGLQTEKSDPVSVTVGAPTTKPTVTGMPPKAFKGMKVTLTCGNVAKLTSDTYQWNVAAAPITGETTQDYELTIDDSNLDNSVTCKRGSLTSNEVKTPGALEDIPSVEVTGGVEKAIKGELVTLKCSLPSGYGAPTGVTYKWMKDGADVSGETNMELTATDSGTYTCEATANSQAQTSSGVALAFSEKMSKRDIAVTPAKPTKNGYSTVECMYRTVDTTIPVTYTWQENSKPLPGVTDRILQFNEPDTLTGQFTCSVTSADGSVTSDPKIFPPIAFEAAAAKPTITPTQGIKGVGNTVTLSCDSPMYTPGGTFTWKVDGSAVSEKSKTFSYKIADTNKVPITCMFAFGGTDSAESNAYEIEAKYILSADIQTGDQTVSGATLTPVHSTKVKLSCKVSKSASAGAVTYAWKKDSTAVATTEDYVLDAGTGTTKMTIDCTATIGTETKTATVDVTPQADAAKPEVQVGDVYLGSKAQMYCVSKSHAEGATFEWMKASTAIAGATSYKYEIASVTAADKASYSCKITVGSKTSVASNDKSVDPKANEVACAYADECASLANMDPTVCENKKCKCKSGYLLRAAQCESSGASTLITSLALTMAAFLVQRFI